MKTPMKMLIHRRSGLALVATAVLAGSALAGCGSGDSDSGDVSASLIIKTQSTSYFQQMATGAKKAAKKNGIKLTVAAGKVDGDEDTQIQAIENSISRGDKGIIITPNGPSVVDALKKAKDAGLYVIALDTVPDPADSVDITYATDNYRAGQIVGQWTAQKLGGKKAVIALLDLFDDKVLTVDYERNQGFLDGMGIDLNKPKVNGDEAKSGTYQGGKGGDYEIVGNQASQGTEDGGRTATETLLSKNPNINVIYGINEPAAYGGFRAMKSAGKTKGLITVAIDGSCDGVKYVEDGILQGTAQQFPKKMAEMGVEAIHDLTVNGKKPKPEKGKDFVNTGTDLVTKESLPGVDSVDVAAGKKTCF